MKISIERSLMMPLIGALFMISGEMRAQVHVKADATGSNDGSSWANAFTDLQAGIDSAESAGAQLWIASGTYLPTTGTDRSATFSITKTIEIYGGFAGTETGIEERDLSQNQTILSGDIGSIGVSSDNSHIVLTCLGNTQGPVLLDGLAFEDARNDVSNGLGGGAYFLFTELTIKNCVFKNNFASQGGGLYSFQGLTTEVISSGFYDNQVDNRGGAIYFQGSNTRRNTIVNSIFVGNVSEIGGGAVMSSGRPVTVINSSFYDNQVNQNFLGGGGLLFAGGVGDSSFVYNSILWANSSPIDPDYAVSGLGILTGDHNIISSTGLGPNDVNTDPQFYVTAHDDLRILNTCSPAINGGDSTLLPQELVEDFAGQGRIQFGQIDIGAHELGGVELVAQDIKCNGEQNGEISFTASLPEEVFFYTGSTFLGSADEETFTTDTLSAGTYPISIAIGCAGNVATDILVAELTIAEPSQISIDSVLTADVSCNGDSSGALEVKVITGGTSPFSYSIDDVNYQTSPVFSGLLADNYTLYVKDGNDCMTFMAIPINEPAVVGLALSESNTIQCNGDTDGEVTVTASGGVGGFTYRINQGSFQSSGVFDDLGAGKHVFEVQDSNGCVATDSITLVEPAEWVISATSTNALCNGNSDGSIDVSVTGGLAPYTYSIDGTNFQASSLIENLAAAEYTVTIRDDQGCQDEVMVTITEPTQLDLTLTKVSDVVCHGEMNGEIIAIGSGGTGPYQYSTDGIQFQSDTIFSGLDAEMFTITVMDANGCTVTETASIAEPDPLDLTFVELTNVSCKGEADGSITLSGGGGIAPYEYSLDGIHFQSGAVFSLLDPGAYPVTIRDANGCTFSKDTNISEPDELSFAFSNVENASCNNQADGVISLAGAGGTAPYQFSLNGATLQSDQLFDQLSAGSYSVEIVDANGCTFSADTVITEPSVLNLSIESANNLTCSDSADGSLVIEGSGGTAPYAYSLDGTNFQSSGVFEQLTAGNYTATVKDLNECIYTVDTVLAAPNPLTLSFATVANVLCNGESNGSIELSSTGGTAPYEFSIDGTTFQTEVLFEQLEVGSYTFTVLDANGCTMSADTVITQPNVLSIGVEQRNSSFTISGSGGSLPYEFAVDDGAFQSSGSFEGLSRGNHTFTIRDANGCEATSEELLVLSADADDAQVRVFPNPVVNSLKITSTDRVKVRVLQLNGREILRREMKNGEGEMSMKGLQPGLYLIQVRDEDNRLLVQEQIVKK